MGPVILLKLVFKNVEEVLCNGYNINTSFKYYYDNNLLYNYDRIFISDLHLSEDILNRINEDEKLKEKIRLFDHNESVTYLNKFDFVNIVIMRNNKYTCSTSLIYDYLLSNKLITRTKAIDDFCNATKLQDTGRWNFDKSDSLPRDLAILFDSVGAKEYINIIFEKLKTQKSFSFTPLETCLIQSEKEHINLVILSYIKHVRIKEIDGRKVGILYINYMYRNEIAQYLRVNHVYNIDYIILVAIDKLSISIRNVNPFFNVRPIAEKIGGKGHFGAAGCDINKENLLDIFKLLE